MMSKNKNFIAKRELFLTTPNNGKRVILFSKHFESTVSPYFHVFCIAMESFPVSFYYFIILRKRTKYFFGSLKHEGLR